MERLSKSATIYSRRNGAGDIVRIPKARRYGMGKKK
jgi:hypothetical protein